MLVYYYHFEAREDEGSKTFGLDFFRGYFVPRISLNRFEYIEIAYYYITILMLPHEYDNEKCMNNPTSFKSAITIYFGLSYN